MNGFSLIPTLILLACLSLFAIQLLENSLLEAQMSHLLRLRKLRLNEVENILIQSYFELRSGHTNVYSQMPLLNTPKQLNIEWWKQYAIPVEPCSEYCFFIVDEWFQDSCAYMKNKNNLGVIFYRITAYSSHIKERNSTILQATYALSAHTKSACDVTKGVRKINTSLQSWREIL